MTLLYGIIPFSLSILDRKTSFHLFLLWESSGVYDTWEVHKFSRALSKRSLVSFQLYTTLFPLFLLSADYITHWQSQEQNSTQPISWYTCLKCSSSDGRAWHRRIVRNLHSSMHRAVTLTLELFPTPNDFLSKMGQHLFAVLLFSRQKDCVHKERNLINWW